MTIKEVGADLDLPLARWPVFYRDGEAFIYDDTDLFLDEDGEHMGQHPRHSELAIYLYGLLVWILRAQLCAVTFDLYLKVEIEMLETTIHGDKKAAARLTPDVALIKGVAQPKKATYVINEDGPAPDVIFEIGSPSTYREDLTNKLRLYADAFRAKEYFTYDPHEDRLWQGPRLKAWRLVNGSYVELERDERGWVWSEELEYWLVEDGAYLRLYDKEGRKLLNPQEEALYNDWRAEQAEARFEQEKRRAEQEKQRAEQAQVQATQEKQRAKQFQSQLNEERQRAEEEKQRAEQARIHAEQERTRAEQAEARIRALEEQLRKRDAETDIT